MKNLPTWRFILIASLVGLFFGIVIPEQPRSLLATLCALAIWATYSWEEIG